MTAKFDPYHKWLAIPPAEQPPNYYRLLGLPLFEVDQDVIAAAAVQRMNFVRKFQKGEQSATAQRVAKEITDAWASLLNVERKRSYDAGLKKGIDAAELAKEFASVPQLPPRAITAVVDVSQTVLNQPPPIPPSTKTAPSSIPHSDRALPLLDSALTIPDSVIGSKPGPSRGWRRPPKNPPAFDSDSHGFPTSPPPAKNADSALDFLPAQSRRKPHSQKKRNKSILFVLLKHGTASFVGLSLGYVILCWLGPQYDFLGLLSSTPKNNERTATLPALANGPASPPPSMPPTPNPPVKSNRFLSALFSKRILPLWHSLSASIDRSMEWAENQEPLGLITAELGRSTSTPAKPAPDSPQQKSRAAVAKAIDWLASNQRADGSWSLKGPYGNVAENENPIGATALAMLALIREGHWRIGSKHYDAVQKGWRVLFESQSANGRFVAKESPSVHALYSHALATIAICELQAKNPRFGRSAQAAIKFCEISQDKSAGGWRYEPNKDSDLSVTGWFVQAIESGKKAHFTVPKSTTDNIVKFLDSVKLEDGAKYRYHPSTPDATLAMTASGLHARLQLGWKRDDPRIIKGMEYLAANLPGPGTMDNYYWLYGSIVMAQADEPLRSKWFDALREAILNAQDPDNGSWNPTPHRWGAAGGRLAITCFNIYSLQLDCRDE